MKLLIVSTILAAVIGAAYYFGYHRNEALCYDEISSEIDSTRRILDDWMSDPSAVNMTHLEVQSLKLKVAEAGANALIWYVDEYKNVCDIYFYGFELNRK